MATRLTQQRVDKWNQAALPNRELAFKLINHAYQQGKVTPQPLWQANKIVLNKSRPSGNHKADRQLAAAKASLITPAP